MRIENRCTFENHLIECTGVSKIKVTFLLTHRCLYCMCDNVDLFMSLTEMQKNSAYEPLCIGVYCLIQLLLWKMFSIMISLALRLGYEVDI